MSDFLPRINSLFDGRQPVEATLEKVLRAALAHFQSETGTIHLFGNDRQMLRLAAQVGLPPQAVDMIKAVPLGKGIAGETAAKGKPIKICNAPRDNSGAASARVGGMVCVPVRKGNAVMGAIGIGTARPHDYTTEETRLLEQIGSLIGGKIEWNKRPAGAAAPPPDKEKFNQVVQLLADAQVAWKLDEHQKSIEMLEKAARIAPHEPRIPLELGHHHGALCDYPAAERAFETAYRVSNQNIAALLVAGVHAIHFHQESMAKGYLEKALRQNPGSVEALVKLAEVEERHQHLDEAVTLIERAIQLNKNCPPALLVRARLHRLQNQLGEAENLLRSFITDFHPNTDTWTRVQCWYELGLGLDRQRRFDEAMAAFAKAKALFLPDASPQIALQHGNQQRIKETNEMLTGEMLNRWANMDGLTDAPRRLAILVGHPRSGTTLLEQVLDTHPDVISLEETLIARQSVLGPLTKERITKNITAMLADATPALINQVRRNYFSQSERFLHQSIGPRLLIEKNPSLTPIIPILMRAFPEAKFLVAIRDPRDVCLSCFMQPLDLNPVSAAYLTLEETVNDYVAMMNFWLAIKPKLPANWIEVRYEDMLEDLEAVARRTLDFLGVPWDPKVLAFNEHAKTKIVRSPTYADVAKPIYKTAQGRWRNYEKHLAPHLEKLEPFVKAFGYE